MDHSADSGTPHTAVEELEQNPSLPSTSCQGEGGGPILVQLLEFKTHLLEAVEELHMRKDAEMHFEDQIGKLVMEKQELEWEREALQHQIETVMNQHTESLSGIKKQFQAKIRNIEEEKGKYQVSAELKDKEINNLKEEVRSLQLLKFNLEKKSKELEQKLALQSRSKDSHLTQLGEVEKRFGALSKQCAAVKKAHETLEQSVDEAMRVNKKLTSANDKQEANIASLKKELEQVNDKLIKTKMTSVTREKFLHSLTGKEQQIERLQHKLSLETEMNKKLEEEHVALRAEKQELLMSLQHNQQLLLSQTQTMTRVEMELQTQQHQHQALKQEHEVMRDKSRAMEDKVARLMECHAAAVTSWDKERKMFLDDIRSEQQALLSVKEAYEQLHKKHTEQQAQHILDTETRNHSRSRLSVSTQVVLPITPSAELLSCSSPQPSASSQTTRPAGAGAGAGAGAEEKPVATGAAEGQAGLNITHHHSSPCSQPVKHGGKEDEGQGKDVTLEEPVTEQQPEEEDVEGAADRREDGRRSAEETGDTRTSESETRDKDEGPGSDGAERREETEEQTPAAQIPTQTAADCSSEKSNTLQVVDSMDAEMPLVVCEPAPCETFRRQGSTQQDAGSSHVNEGRGTERGRRLSHDEDQRRVDHGPERAARWLPEHIHQVSERTTEETPAEPPVLPSAAQTNFITFSISESETTAAQSEQSNPPDMKHEAGYQHATEHCESVRRFVKAQPFHEKGQETSLTPGEDDSGAKGQSNVDKQENSEIIQMKPDLKDVCVDVTMDAECVKGQDQMRHDKPEDAGDEKTNKSETHVKTSVPSTGPGSSFEPVPVQNQFTQGSEQSNSGSAARLKHLPSRSTIFPESKHSKVPLVITRALDLLNTSSVSGNAAPSARQQRGERKASTTAADAESRASSPVAPSLSTVGGLSWPTTPGCGAAASSAPAAPGSDSDCELTFSPEREEQQDSFRAQISRIERFLNTERLCLPKRRRTDN